MQVVLLELTEAALLGSALTLIIFLIWNCCGCFKASHVQDLNKTIANVASDFVEEVDSIAQRLAAKGEDSPPEDYSVTLDRLMVYTECLSIVRRMQLACDLVEVSLTRLKSRRVPKTKKYKHNLNEERQSLKDSAKQVYSCV